MKIVVLGGNTRSLVNFRGELLVEMMRHGYEVVACAPSDNPVAEAKLKEMGVRFIPAPLERTGTNPINDFKAIQFYAQLLRQEKPDKLFCYTIKPVIYGTLAAKRARVKERYAMVTGLGSAFEKGGWKKRLLTSVVKRMYRRAFSLTSAIIVQNPDDMQDLIDFGLARKEQFSIVNGSGVDCTYFAPAPLPGVPIRFLCLSRLIGDKGVREYAKAAGVVKERHPEVRFDLYGALDPNPSAISEAEVREWEAQGWLKWHGRTEDVRPCIADCSVYVLPSYREGTPRSVLEALAMGRAIITTDAPGCRETIRDGVEGFLVPPRTVDELAAAMERFIAEPSLIEQMSDRALQRALDKYDVKKVNADMLRIMRIG